MTTDQGAIYVTNNRAYTWSAAVLETVDATLNRTVSSGEWGVLAGAHSMGGLCSKVQLAVVPASGVGPSPPAPCDLLPPLQHQQASVAPPTMRAASATLRAAPQATMWQCPAAATSS
jgi:hypothetical protein